MLPRANGAVNSATRGLSKRYVRACRCVQFSIETCTRWARAANRAVHVRIVPRLKKRDVGTQP
eukprot:6765960-Pyramimonas_sp.AAC.1